MYYQQSLPPPLHRRRWGGTRSALLFSVFLTIVLLAQSLSAWSAPVVLAATNSLKPLHLPTGTQTFKQFLKEGQHSPVKPYRLTGKLPLPPGTQHDKQGKLLPSAEPPTMKPLSATLDAAFLNAVPGTKSLDLHSSDGRLEVQLVPGLFDLSHASIVGGKGSGTGTGTGATGKGSSKAGKAGKSPTTGGASSSSFAGSLIFTITEQHGYYVGEQIYLGEYTFALTDSHGHAVSGVVVRTPMTVRYHYQKAVIDSFDLDPGRLFLDWPVALMNAFKQHKTDPTGMLPLQNNPKTHTLTTLLSDHGPGPFDLMGDPSNESPPIPHLAGEQGNSGQLSYSYPLQTPPGPDGFGPSLQLSYSSNDAPTMTKTWTYKPDDQTIGGTVYYDVNKAIHSEVDDSNGTAWQCQNTTYDEGNTSGVGSGLPVAGWPTTVITYSNCANKSTAITTYTGYDAYGNTVATVDGVASANSSLYGSSGTSPDNGCTLPTTPVIMSSNWNKTNYTTCTTYDQYNGQAFEALPSKVFNAFGQYTTYGYDYTQGELPISLTDANNKQTTTAYIFDDGSANNDKRSTNVSEPGECGTCYTKESNTYSSCAESIPTSTTAPCFEINSSTSEYSSEVSSTFYDSLGRAVETSVPTASPNPDDGKEYFTVTITEYNDANATTWTTEPFVVAVSPGQGGVTGTGWLDPANLTDYKGGKLQGTTAFLDALGRTIAVRDPLYDTSSEPGVTCSKWLPGSYTACTNYGIGQLNGGSSDSHYYLTTKGLTPTIM